MKNKLKLLKNENYKYSQNLREEDEAVIKRILNYLRTAKLCSYQTEIVRKDLIGMSLSAAKRGETLEKALGISEKEFCHEIAVSGHKTSIWEKLFLVTGQMALLTLGTFLLLAWGAYGSFEVTMRPEIIAILMLLFLACTLANQFILPRFSLERGVRRFLLNTGVLIVTYAPAFIFALYGRTNHSGILLTIPILPFSFCLLLLWGISEFFYRREIEKTAELLS